jgi:hypothetical protein
MQDTVSQLFDNHSIVTWLKGDIFVMYSDRCLSSCHQRLLSACKQLAESDQL